MHFWSTFAIAVLGSALFATAAPTPTEDIVARSCQTAGYAVARVEEARPNTSYLSSPVIIGQKDNKVDQVDTFFEFYTPPGSYGCQLEAYFPTNYPITNIGPESNRRVNVYAVEAPLSRSPHGIDISWNYCPAPGSLVGTITLKSDPTKPTKVVINSFTCARAMAYRFMIAPEINGAGSVKFTQTPSAGIRMVYNC